MCKFLKVSCCQGGAPGVTPKELHISNSTSDLGQSSDGPSYGLAPALPPAHQLQKPGHVSQAPNHGGGKRKGAPAKGNPRQGCAKKARHAAPRGGNANTPVQCMVSTSLRMQAYIDRGILKAATPASNVQEATVLRDTKRVKTEHKPSGHDINRSGGGVGFGHVRPQRQQSKGALNSKTTGQHEGACSYAMVPGVWNQGLLKLAEMKRLDRAFMAVGLPAHLTSIIHSFGLSFSKH